jgi:hypothetical protein
MATSKEDATNVVAKFLPGHPAQYGNWKMSLIEMQTFVGGYIEYVQSNQARRALVVNEDALLRNLPINPSATIFMRSGVWAVDGQLRGPVLMVKD